MSSIYLSTPRLTTREIGEALRDRLPTLNVDVEEFCADWQYRQDVMIEAAQPTYRSTFYPKPKKKIEWAVTFTTGFEMDPHKMVARCKRLIDELDWVVKIQGTIELTKAGRPHIHMIIELSKPLSNKAQIASRNKPDTQVKMVNIYKKKGWIKYMNKKDKVDALKAYLKQHNIDETFIFV